MPTTRSPHPRFFACNRCGSPNPVKDGAPAAFVICHACETPTRGPSKRSRRLLSHSSGETCPFFCEESRSNAHHLCSHTSAEAAALADATPLPWAALAGVFTLSALLATAIGLLLV